MKKEIYSQHAPKPVGAYSQAVQVSGMVFVSGQIALDPETGELNNTSLEVEAQQVFENISHVLEAAELTPQDVVRAEMYMTDITKFDLVNALYERWLGKVDVKPARQTVEVRALPKGAALEVSCIASVQA